MNRRNSGTGAAIGSAIGAGIAAGILWWIVNGMATVNGQGCLARQVWPVNNVWLVALGGAAVGFLGALYARGRQRKHAESIEDLCRQWGFRYHAEVKESDLPPMPVFSGWVTGRNRMSGERQGVPVEIFDLRTVQKQGDADSAKNQTVFLLPAEGLPEFNLRRRGLGWRLLAAAGAAEVTFDAAAVRDPVGAVEAEMCQKRFSLTAPDEQAARRFFTPAVMRAVNRLPGWSIESHGGHLAFWQEGREQRASVREKLLSEAIELRSGLIGQARSSVGDAVPALPPEVVARDRARLAVANLGGCLGIPLGFFGGFIVFVTFMVSVEPKFEAFWLMALLFFGSLGGGAILGGVLGRWIAAGIARLLPAGRVATALGTSLSPEAALRRARAKPGASSTSQPPLFLGVIFALVGTVFAGVGIGMGVWWTVWAVGARRTEGTVVSMVASGDEGGMAPVVSYQVAGKTYEHRSKFSSSPPAYSVGNKVSILYRPENPSEAGIDSLFDRWLFPVCFGGVGSLFAAIGWGIIIRSRRRSPGHGD